MHVEMHANVWALNNKEGTRNRQWLDARHIWAINIMGSPGAGKTTLLESLLPYLSQQYGHRIAVIEGDVATAQDAQRISALSIPVIQLETEGICHLDGRMVQSALEALKERPIDLLFIENVGNLVCPADFFLGEHARLAVLSTVEGRDKIVKYPTLFRRVDGMVISKTDLLPYTDFSLEDARNDFSRCGAGRPVFDVNRNQGIPALAQWVHEKHQAMFIPPEQPVG
jgi:hydrogenase nickel incorporation protein HypB